MAVAQLVESQIVILVVVGSSPISHPKKYLLLRYCSIAFKGFQRRACPGVVISEPPLFRLRAPLFLPSLLAYKAPKMVRPCCELLH